jgi:Mg2+ and Co2+ transporter CorA
MYFQIFTLLLAYRASIIKFADDIQEITNKDDDSLINESKKLYKNYLNFLNKLYFKEVTAQEQGIELYNQAIKLMDIEKYLKDLDNEINELFNYIELIESKKETEQMNKLTKLGTLFLPPSLVASIFGMNVFPENSMDNICGWVVSFGLMFGLTWHLSKIHNINIKEFFIKKDKDE